MNTKRTRVGLLALVAAAVFTAQPASADTLKYQGSAYGYVSTSGMTDPVAGPPVPITTHPAAGGFLMSNLTNPSGSFLAWCVDIYGWLNTSAGGTTYNLMAGTDFYSDAGKVNALERLASGQLHNVNTRAESGAFQLAVWEIVNETSGSYSLSGGAFRVASASDGAKGLANTWLSQLGTYQDTMKLSIWKDVNNNTQDLAVFAAAAPIPEPEIYAMMMAGLGLMGFVARRRRQQGATV